MENRDYRKLLDRLTPAGEAWNGRNFSAMLNALADTFYELDQKIEAFRIQRFPRTATLAGLLVEHETDLGLPDECTQLGTSEFERQRIAHTKLTRIKGMSKYDIEEIIRGFGFDGEITYFQYSPFLIGYSRIGDRIGGSSFLFYTKITIDDAATDAMKATLQCILSAYSQPTETIEIEFLQEYGNFTCDTTAYTCDTTAFTCDKANI